MAVPFSRFAFSILASIIAVRLEGWKVGRMELIQPIIHPSILPKVIMKITWKISGYYLPTLVQRSYLIFRIYEATSYQFFGEEEIGKILRQNFARF